MFVSVNQYQKGKSNQMFPYYIIKIQNFEDNDHNASNRLSHEQEKVKYSEKVIIH